MQPALVLIFLEIFGEFHSYSTWYKVIKKCLRLYAMLDVSVRVTKYSSLPISPSTFPSPSVMSPPDVVILSINTSGTMSSPTISSTMAQLPIFSKNFANSAPYGHHFHYHFHFQIHLVAQFQLCICSSQLQQHLNFFQATVNIWNVHICNMTHFSSG